MKIASLKNKTVIVTAGNQGGGAIVAARFAEAGAKVAIIAHTDPLNITPLNQASDSIIQSGGTAQTWEADLLNAASIRAVVNEIASQFGQIDVLVNNFSFFHFKPSLETTPEEFNRILGNIHATFFLSQACVPYLQKSENPHVINIAPPLDMDCAKAACEHHLLFSIGKYGMSLCTLGMAEEFKNAGIAINSLWQARPVVTQTLQRNFDDIVSKGSNKAEIYAEAAYQIVLMPAKDFTGNFVIDEEFLTKAGQDIQCYAIDPAAKPVRDIFLPGVDYAVLKRKMEK